MGSVVGTEAMVVVSCMMPTGAVLFGAGDGGSSGGGRYSEVKDCVSLPGCEKAKGTEAVGHFTALVN